MAAVRAAKFLREEQVEDNDSGLRRQVATQQQDQGESRKKVLMEAARLEQGAVAVERAEAANHSMVDEQGGGAAPARAKGAADGAAFGAARR